MLRAIIGRSALEDYFGPLRVIYVPFLIKAASPNSDGDSSVSIGLFWTLTSADSLHCGPRRSLVRKVVETLQGDEREKLRFNDCNETLLIDST